MLPTIPINHYPWHTNQQSRPRVLSYFHAFVSTTSACLKHSKFLKGKVPNTAPHNEVQLESSEKMPRAIQTLTRKGGPTVLDRNPTASFLTTTTLIYPSGAGIIAAAGTRLALQFILVKRCKFYPFQLQDMERPVLLFLVTTSLCQDWVICAPAAFLGSGSRFSGSLSKIEH